MPIIKKVFITKEELDAKLAAWSPSDAIDAFDVGGLTPGSIPFADATGYLIEDNVALFWDEANEILKITSATAPLIELNPAFTGTGSVVTITPSASLVEGRTWHGVLIEANALDPATGDSCIIHGVHFDATGLASVDHDSNIVGFVTTAPKEDSFTGFSATLRELEQNKTQNAFRAFGGTPALSATGIYNGLFVDWDGITRDAGAPVLHGVHVLLPGNYSNFGVSHAGYFEGDGRSVTLCDTTYALTTSGNMNLVGTIIGVTELTVSTFIRLSSNGEIRFYDNGNYVGFEAPALTANQIWVLPDEDGDNLDFLQTDGAGNLSWAPGGGGGDVTAALNMADNFIIRGDGGLKGIQDSGVFIDDADNVSGMVTLTLPNEGLHILDTNASHDLIIKAGSDLTVDRILSFVTGDVARTITLQGNPTLNDWFDQDVKQAAVVSFGGITDTGITATNIAAGTTGQRPGGIVGDIRYNSTLGGFEAYIGSWKSVKWVGDAPTAHAASHESGGGDAIDALTFSNEGLHILDTNASHDLIIKAGSDLTADRIFTLYTGDAAKEITLTGNPTLDNWFDQSVKVGASPTFAGLIITDIFVENHGADHNLFLGHLAGSSIAGGGQYNIFLGELAGQDLTLGDKNIFIGYSAGQEAGTTSWGNICIGYLAGEGVDGNIYHENTLIGFQCGKVITTLDRTVAIGAGALEKGITGYNLITIGWQAAYESTSSYKSVSIGAQANYYGATGYSNTAIGNEAMKGTVANACARNVAIGDSACHHPVTGAANNVCIGVSAGYYMHAGVSNVLIGYQAGFGVIGNSFTSNVFIGAETGKVCTTGGQNVCIGHGVGASLTTGTYNVLIGYLAGSKVSTTGNNTYVGRGAGEAATGTGNTCFGSYALRANAGGNYNTVMGVQALTNAGAQSHNIGIGFAAGLFQNTGSYNVYIGNYSGYLDDGLGNIYIGYEAGRNSGIAGSQYNVAIGYAALKGNIAGVQTHNTAIGYQAGYSVNAAIKNVFIGGRAGFSGTSGDNNVIIGYYAGYHMTTGSGNVVIGYYAAEGRLTVENNRLWIANTNTATPLIYGEFDTPLLKVTGEFDVVGPSKLGDGGTTNYAETKADGEINLHGTARVIKQIYLNNAAFTKGATAPTQVILGNLNAWKFDIGDDAVMTAMLLPDWAAGTLITIKVCWYIDEAYAADKEIQWRVDWSALPHDFSEAVDAPTHSGQIDSGDIDIPAVAKRMGISTIGTIAGANLSAGDMLGFTLSRIAVTHDDPTADPAIHHLIIEYTADKLGTAT